MKRCSRCKQSEKEVPLTKHHILPVRTHPYFAHIEENILILCWNCHMGFHGGRWKEEEININLEGLERKLNKKYLKEIEAWKRADEKLRKYLNKYHLPYSPILGWVEEWQTNEEMGRGMDMKVT